MRPTALRPPSDAASGQNVTLQLLKSISCLSSAHTNLMMDRTIKPPVVLLETQIALLFRGSLVMLQVLLPPLGYFYLHSSPAEKSLLCRDRCWILGLGPALSAEQDTDQIGSWLPQLSLSLINKQKGPNKV